MVKIYLRSIVKDEKNSLALFDSNRKGDINDLITHVPPGNTIFWKLDCYSGIKSITRIYSKKKEHSIFKSNPIKLPSGKGFKVQLSESAKEKEAYTIEYILMDEYETKVIIDPFIQPDPIKVVKPK